MSTTPVKKACDACHRRKVRCTGEVPCRNCAQANLSCTYLAIPQKKGPKGSRAKVISEIRDKQQAKSPTSTRDFNSETSPFDFALSPLTSRPTPNTALLDRQIIDACVNFYFSHLYATIPIFSRQRLEDVISFQLGSSVEAHCLIAALCAFILIQPGMTLEGSQTLDGGEANSRLAHASLLVVEINNLRKTLDYVETPSLHAVQTSFLLFASFFGLDKSNQGYFFLRESATLAQLLLMHEESSYRTGDPVENIYKRRTYWTILLTERAYAMERHRPLSLYPTIELPSIDDVPHESMVVRGFLYLIAMYRLIDEEFMAIWNKAKSECSPTWLTDLQQQLTNLLPPDLECTPNQAADVLTSQHWLRTMVWQLSITNGYLSSSSPDTSMTFRYPIQIAKDLVRDVQKLTQQSMEVHGIGLIEKLFDVACTLTDVIACVPLAEQHAEAGEAPSECLNQLLSLISRLRGGLSRYQPLLAAKVSENLPSLTYYLQTSMNVPAGSNSQADATPPPQSARNSPHIGRIQTAFTQDGFIHSPSEPRGYMFEAYSPSPSVSELGLTPSTPPMDFRNSSPFLPMYNPASIGPRSIPRSTSPTESFKYNAFPGQL